VKFAWRAWVVGVWGKSRGKTHMWQRKNRTAAVEDQHAARSLWRKRSRDMLCAVSKLMYGIIRLGRAPTEEPSNKFDHCGR